MKQKGRTNKKISKAVFEGWRKITGKLESRVRVVKDKQDRLLTDQGEVKDRRDLFNPSAVTVTDTAELNHIC